MGLSREEKLEHLESRVCVKNSPSDRLLRAKRVIVAIVEDSADADGDGDGDGTLTCDEFNNAQNGVVEEEECE
jgi:hypothetical protein